MKKRIVSFLMALVMVVSVLPVSAFAEELPAEAPVAAQAVTEGVAGTEEPLTEPAPTAEEGDAAVGDSETSAEPTITTDLAETVAVKTGDALTRIPWNHCKSGSGYYFPILHNDRWLGCQILPRIFNR